MNDIFERVKECGGAMTLNLSKTEDYDYLLDKLGGKVRLADYSQINTALEDTKAAHEKGQGTDYKTLLQRKEESANELIDAVYIAYAHFDSSTRILSYCCVVSLTQTATNVNVQIDIYNDQQHQIYKSYTDYEIKNFIIIRDEKKIDTSYSIYHNVFDVAMTVCIFTLNEQGTLRMDPVIAVKRFYTNQIISSVTVAHPMQKVSTGDTINVFYGRLPQYYDPSVDYIYENALKGNSVNMMLDMMGSANFTDSSTNVTKFLKDETDIIMDLQKGAINYGNMDVMQYSGSDGTLSWLFKTEWGQKIPRDDFQASNISYINMMMRYNTDKTGDNPNTLTISSYLADRTSQLSNDNVMVKTFNLKIGCLAKDIEITLADGSRKNVQDVKVGDVVRTDNNGSTATVENIWSGIDQRMIVIETENHDRTIISTAHLVETADGLLEAAELNAGMQVMTEKGLCKILFLYDIAYNDTVYNLQLSVPEGTGRFFAGGILVGDAGAEKEQASLRKVSKEASNSELYEEFKKLDAVLEQMDS